ncbi:MAG: dethiobiotin synthase [Candidatus Omnitrophota bacterium]
MSRGIFITGTDTGAGKTVISGLLGRYLAEKGYNVITQKWVQTGDIQDVDRHLGLMKISRPRIKDCLSRVCPYNFKFAASAHLAACLERKKIAPDKIKRSFQYLSRRFDVVIVEGTGGALVPFSRKGLIIDIVKELHLPAIIVAANKLGAINHTLLTVEALRKRRITVAGIIFNNIDQNADERVLTDNIKIIRTLSGEKVLGILPYRETDECLYRQFVPIGRKILSRWIPG